MDKNLKLTTSVDIEAPPSKVWNALTDPKLIKQYFYGSKVTCDWKKGSPIIFTGEWEGKPYVEKGEIVEIDEGKRVMYSYLTAGLEDNPDNYALITYQLKDKGPNTTLTVIQEGFRNQEAYEHSVGGWNLILEGLKDVVEK